MIVQKIFFEPVLYHHCGPKGKTEEFYGAIREPALYETYEEARAHATDEHEYWKNTSGIEFLGAMCPSFTKHVIEYDDEKRALHVEARNGGRHGAIQYWFSDEEETRILSTSTKTTENGKKVERVFYKGALREGRDEDGDIEIVRGIFFTIDDAVNAAFWHRISTHRGTGWYSTARENRVVYDPEKYKLEVRPAGLKDFPDRNPYLRADYSEEALWDYKHIIGGGVLRLVPIGEEKKKIEQKLKVVSTVKNVIDSAVSALIYALVTLPLRILFATIVSVACSAGVLGLWMLCTCVVRNVVWTAANHPFLFFGCITLFAAIFVYYKVCCIREEYTELLNGSKNEHTFEENC